MKAKELKEYLENVDDNAEILTDAWFEEEDLYIPVGEIKQEHPLEVILLKDDDY